MMEHARESVRDPRTEVAQLTDEPAKRRVVITWRDGHVSNFPYVWLRHARYFPVMGRPEFSSEVDYVLPEPPELPRLSDLSAERGRLVARWHHDDSVTEWPLAWLRDHCLSAAARHERQPLPELWSGRQAAAFSWHSVDDLVHPARRLQLFEQLRNRGLVLVKDVPTEPGTIARLARHFGPIRRTHHGSLFDIRSLPVDRLGAGQNIGATASNALAPHMDEVFRHTPIGIMLFHCLTPDPSGGGASLFVDGVAVAEDLRRRDPDAFSFLAKTPLVWAAERNPKERFRTRARLIATDSLGVVRGVRASDRTMPPMDLPEDQIGPAYDALRAFYDELQKPERAYERRLQPGEMVVFDNHRVLHARRSFDPSAGERHLQQLSVDREEFHSIFRQLAEQQGRQDLANWEPDAGVLSQA